MIQQNMNVLVRVPSPVRSESLINIRRKVIEEEKHGTCASTSYEDKEIQDNLEEGNNDENLNLPNEQEVETTSTKHPTFPLTNYRENSSRNSTVEGTTLHTSTLPTSTLHTSTLPFTLLNTSKDLFFETRINHTLPSIFHSHF